MPKSIAHRSGPTRVTRGRRRQIRQPIPTGSRPGQGSIWPALPLGRWAGVSVSAHFYFVALLVMVANLFTTVIIPAVRPGASPVAYWVCGIVISVALLASVLAHDLSQIAVAGRLGLQVRRVTLWGLGSRTEWETAPSTPRLLGVVALVGPVASGTVGIVVGLAASAIGSLGLGTTGAWVELVMVWTALLNGALAVMHLLPAAPLDGGLILISELWRRTGDRARAERRAAIVGRGVAVLAIVVGGVGLVLGQQLALALMLVGWLLLSSSVTPGILAHADQLEGHTAAEVMSPLPVVLGDWWNVERSLERLGSTMSATTQLLLTDFDGRPTGLLSGRVLLRLPAVRRPDVQLRQLVRPAWRPLLVGADHDLGSLLPVLHLHQDTGVVVDEHLRPLGLITGADIAHAFVGRDR
jgi:Zn-dependent protease